MTREHYVAALLLVPLAATGAAPPPEVALVWHVEDGAGGMLDAQGADEPINPASVVKLATTLRALEVLGPHHRFETRLAFAGRFDPLAGVLDGDLVVLGGADPDFQVENAFLVALELNRLGLRRVTGSLLVDDRFWIGWEGGASRKPRSPEARSAEMAARLRAALDPRRWSRDTRGAWTGLASRRALRGAAPSVSVDGGTGTWNGADSGPIRVTHRSNELSRMLKRFNTYSNNDIERLEASIGPARVLAANLAARWNSSEASLYFDTLSGLGTNRMTPRLAVRLVRDLARTCDRLGLTLEDVLPLAGCGASTLSHLPGLRRSAATRALVAKTGTLIHTDGGVSVLAGVARTGQGDRLFCVAAPRAGRAIWAARQGQADFVLDLLARHGGPRRQTCPAGPGLSDAEASAEAPAAAPPTSTAGLTARRAAP